MEKNVGTNIKELREFRGMEPSSFAKKCKVDIEQLKSWEKGELEPSISDLYKISRSCGISLYYFLENWYATKDELNFNSGESKLTSIGIETLQLQNM